MSLLYQRSRWEGVANIVRFNWHFYTLALIALLLATLLIQLSFFSSPIPQWLGVGAGIAFFYLTGSLAVSHFIYDLSDLYRFQWLKRISLPATGHFVNVHSGFDETSLLLKQHFPQIRWTILDFYDPKIHTEVSIARARKHRPVLPETVRIQATQWNLDAGSVAVIFGLLAVHEIRDDHEKVLFFEEAYRVLQVGGTFILVEHLQDTANFLAYGPGFRHFFPEKVWKTTFTAAQFRLANQFCVTPFVNVFVLVKQ